MNYELIYIIILILFIIFCIRNFKRFYFEKHYSTSTIYKESSFPLTVFLVDSGQRLIDFDLAILKKVLHTFNSNLNFHIFNLFIKVICYENYKFLRKNGSFIFLSFEDSWSLKHSSHKSFDGPGNVLAHAEMPPGNKICFDFSENWSKEMFFSTAIHEFGHILGLEHTNENDSIMTPHLKFFENLYKKDIKDLQTIYPFFKKVYS